MLAYTDPGFIGGTAAAGLFVGILLFLALGRRIGNRTIARYGATGAAGIGSLESAVFALLGLLIAFTFSGALGRFDERRARAVDEANAMSTAYLRLDLLPAAAQPAMRDSFRAYVDARIATYASLPDMPAVQREYQRSVALQGEVWTRAVAAATQAGNRPGTEGLVLPALNQMFDLSAVRMSATLIHPPGVVYAMLIGLALASALLAGYQSAGARALSWMHQFAFAAIVALTVYVILDIEYPRLGFVRLDAIDQLLVSARAAMR